MRGKSQASHDAVLRLFDPVVTAAGKDGLMIAEQLFSVVDALDSSASLRRAMTDPARPGTDKSVLVKQLFAGVDSRVEDVLVQFVSQRWSSEQDLAQSIENAGVNALLAYAESDKTLATVEEELFRIERLLVGERDLLVAMGNRAATKETRLELLDDVLGGKLAPVTKALMERAVGTPRGNRLVGAIKSMMDVAAWRRERLVAWVSAAVEMSASQRKRLGTILQNIYGREVQINVAVDPAVIGGIRVQVGAEVVDGTVLTRLDEARRRLVG
ncbi:MAG: F0F1 ATP synthase subunit delta [Actinobacteria bacterium HGW-Actinobacteria-4]|nr:MAG: F0F1 ATP synthase subunit delta [Actinobacteria bacterium HGW-Actinobacteria-4]